MNNQFLYHAQPDDVVFLFIDHQSGLLQTVNSMPLEALRANVETLAKCAHLLQAPVVYTSSLPEGPNGPALPEIKANAPKAVYVSREGGEINAWDNTAFVKAVGETGKKTLVIAGIWTSVCVTFPSIAALAAGYKVYGVMDASGDLTKDTHEMAIDRMVQAGVIPISTNALMAELQKTWNRKDAAAWGELYGAISPNYQAVTESFNNKPGNSDSKQTH